MTMEGLGFVTDCSTIQLHKAMVDQRVVNVVREIEEVAQRYMDGRPGIIISDNKLTADKHVFVKIITTFRFPL